MGQLAAGGEVAASARGDFGGGLGRRRNTVKAL